MNRFSPSVARTAALTSLALALITAISLFAGSLLPRTLAAGTPAVQFFFVPLPEDQVRASFLQINTTRTTGSVLRSVTGISITQTGAIIYYDQWENGYELDIANPTNVWSAGNTGGTQIWGDGNTANGNVCPLVQPASLCSGDVLQPGAVIVLQNDVTVPRNPSIINYDGRDKIGATKVVAVTKSNWALDPGSVLADAVEVVDTTRWGTSFKMPIGQNISSSSIFEYVSMLVMAGENGTTVQIDKDGNGSVDISTTLNQGESYQVNGGVNANASVTSSKPVQVDLITGDVGSTWECRWFNIPPTDQWDYTYYTPVGTVSSSYPANVWLYNPNPSAITVNYETKASTGSFSIPAGGTYRYLMPSLSGAHFFTTNNAVFLAVGANDNTTTATSNQTYDWGYTLLPESFLTTAFAVGWAPGTSDLSGNGSPVWVTAVRPTTIYVDYDGNPNIGPLTDPNGRKYDVSYNLGLLESKTIYDPDKDQTGMRVYTLDSTLITGAWGEDASKASPGNPYLDVGYTIPPLPQAVVEKMGEAYDDPNGNGQVDPGEQILYTITAKNLGVVTFFNTIIEDSLPAEVTYVPNSTTFNGNPVPDNTPPATIFPLDEGGANVGNIPVRGTIVVQFRVTANPFPPVYTEITNEANVYAGGDKFTVHITLPVTPNNTTCAVNGALFTNSGGTPVTSYLENATVYIEVSDGDKNANIGAPDTVNVLVQNTTNGDRETVTLTETGNNTGVFRGSLPTSTTLGAAVEDGTLKAVGGDSLSVDYVDAIYGDACSDTATIITPSLTKQLYLSTDGSGSPDQDLDRISPTVTNDTLTAISAQLNGSGGATTFTQTPAMAADFSMPSGGTISATAWVSATGSLPANPNITAQLKHGATTFATLTNPAATLISSGSSTVSAASTTSSTTSNGASLTFSHTPGAGSNRLLLVAVAVGGTSTGGGTPPTVTGITFGGTAMSQVVTTVNGSARTYIYRLTNPSSAAANVVVSLSGSGSAAAGATTFTGVNQTTPLGTAASNSATGGTTASVTVSSASGELVFSTAAWDEGLSNQSISTSAGQTQLWNHGGLDFVSAAASTKPGAASVTSSYTAGDSQEWVAAAVPIKPAVGESVYRLDWSGILSSATTVPSGQAIDLTLTNGATPSMYVLYDSVTYPSVVNLPTTTVINVDAIAVYDAPYPGGSLIIGAANGQTVYVRATISDPFGAYDIRAADIVIKDPVNATIVNTALTNVISSTTGSKTYEYAWTTPVAEGEYTIEVSTDEGYENAISDTASIPFDVRFQDAGTPSTTEFTTGNNGPGTPTYSPDEQVCVRTTDIDQNKNPLVAETVQVTITSSGGDSETLTLIETGLDTGVFAACIPASSTTQGTSNNGTLYAPQGSLLTVSYTDPDDPTDISGDTATVPTLTPAMSIGKTLVQPSDGIAVVGETVRFDIVVGNTGPTSLTTVTVTDSFDDTCLAFSSASLTPSSQTASSLTWNAVGPIASGSSTTISVYFDAIDADPACVPTTNTVQASATDQNGTPVSAGPANATVILTLPEVQVTKSLIDPASGTAQVGDVVTYRITILNVGTTAIESLPLIDSYSAYCLEYVSATTPPDGAGGGTILWSNLLPGAATLPVGDSITIDVDSTVAGPCNPVLNIATTSGATDVNGDPVSSGASGAGSTDLITTADLPVLAITKTLVDPVSGVASPGDTIVFEIELTNTGPNAITSLTLTDTYDDACMTLTSANPTPTQQSAGQALWNTLIPSLPPLLPNQSTTVVLTFSADAVSNSCVNTASATGLDQFGQTVPTVGDNADVIIGVSTIGDFVWLDDNGNGIQDVGEPGLANVDVRLYTSANVLVDTQTTDATGFYEFTTLPGDYYLEFVAPSGYEFTLRDVNSNASDSVDSDADPLTGRTVTFSVAANEVQDNWDAGLYEPVTIGDFVFLDPNGDGSQQAGETLGLSNVPVTAVNVLTGVTYGPEVTLGGFYLLANLPPGTYEVSVPATMPGLFRTTPAPITVNMISGSTYLNADFGYISPTAVQLTDFTAVRSANGVEVKWSTASEEDLQGFVVWRATGPYETYKQVSGRISAQNSPEGASYSWIDKSVSATGEFWYKIEVQPDGEFFGPVRVSPEPGSTSSRLYLPFLLR